MRIFNKYKEFLACLKESIFNNLLSNLDGFENRQRQRSFEYLEWINSDLVLIAEDFVKKNKILDSYFVEIMKNSFRTSRFELFIKRWVVEYYLKLFRVLDEINFYKKDKNIFILLEDNPLNHYGVQQYKIRFGSLPQIKWKKQPILFLRFLILFIFELKILHFSLNSEIKLKLNRKKYIVLRESLWGLSGVGGLYFHDDFFVDGDKIRKDDILLFSRGIPTEEGRLKAYYDAQRSNYSHFNIYKLSISFESLFSRVIPKYIIFSIWALARSIFSANFSFFSNLLSLFIHCALPYEKIFSNYKIVSEFGHNYFSSTHIAESIICQNHGTKYYLMHWGDSSIGIDKYLLSFLGCDKFLLWGKSHIQHVEGKPEIFFFTGYIFKKFIKEVMSKRKEILAGMAIQQNGKIISFFDETFGREIKMTEECFVVFWETVLKVALIQKEQTILIKQKNSSLSFISDELKNRFILTKTKLKNLDNVYFAVSKWSFIEVIGVSDIVVTQGMTTSATIALICGLEGLYLDQANYTHPFSMPLLKDKIVFDNPENLLEMISEIIAERTKPSEFISKDLLRGLDAYEDCRGIDLFRSILSGDDSVYESFAESKKDKDNIEMCIEV